jgi:hypothetical protein
MIIVLVIAAMVWVAASPDRVASPLRAAAVAAARGGSQTGRTAAAARWAAGAPGRAERRQARAASPAGRAVNAAGSGLAGLGRIAAATTGTAGAAVAGAGRAAGYEFADARELHRYRRQRYGNRTDALVARIVERVRRRLGLLPPAAPTAATDAGDPGAVPSAGTTGPATGPAAAGSGVPDPAPGTGGAGQAQPEVTPEEAARQAAMREVYAAQSEAARAERAWRHNENNPPVPPAGPPPPADAPQVVLAQHATAQARYAAEKAKWDLARERLRRQSDAAEARLAAARQKADLPPDPNAPTVPPADPAAAGADKDSLPTGEGSTTEGTTDSTTNGTENADMAPTTSTLDVPNADALLAVAKTFTAAAEAASQLQAIAMNAQNLPDALGYGPGNKVLQVIMALAELAPDPKQLGEFADTLPRLEQELQAQLNRNEVIDNDGLTGEAKDHVLS